MRVLSVAMVAGAALLALIVTCAGCKAATVGLENLACDPQGGCLPGYACDQQTNTCVPIGLQDGPGPQQDTQTQDSGRQDGGQDAGAPTLVPYESLSAGGARLTSPNYKLDVFVAPVAPAGTGVSTTYRVRLGPEPKR